MTWLIFGKTGQVATALSARLPQAVLLGRDKADLSDPQACADAINAHAPSLVINAAAYTAVDQAEDEETLATTINGTAPGAMATTCAARGIPFLHISTDYVFDGTGDAPWTPDAPTGPLGAYGRSKLAGEQAVVAAGGAHCVLRTAWVFSATGGNFVKSMLRLAETRDRLTIVADQFGAPTEAGDIADALITMGHALLDDPGKTGIYHFSGAPYTNWDGFAREIFAHAGKSVEVVDIPSSDFPTKATRPGNSRLDCTSLEQRFGIKQPDWRTSLSRVVTELT
ncbi:MAG: dTDP-4-dehydrorhamnose reductase [Pseudomonadota bacterium]